MPDYAKLRAAAEAMLVPHAGAVDDRFFEMWKPGVCLALLDELESLRPAPKVKQRDNYPPEFERAWEAYPYRPGSVKAATFKAWAARLKAGVRAEDMLAGAKKYAAYVLAVRTEQQFIKQAQTFFGPSEHYSADWTITKAEGRKGQIHGSIGKQDFSAGVRPDGSF